MSLGLAPALPLPALSAGAASTAGATSATASHMYFMGWYTARMNETCSPEMLVSKLKVKPDVAHEIFGKLVSSNTVSAPNALGISQTIDPLPQRFKVMSARAVKPDLIEATDTAPKKPALKAEQSREVEEDAQVQIEDDVLIDGQTDALSVEQSTPEDVSEQEQGGETLFKADDTL